MSVIILEIKMDNNSTVDKCPICLINFHNDRINLSYYYRRTKLKCGHFYHRQCIKQWIESRPKENKTCPYCQLKDPLSEEERMKKWNLDYIIKEHPHLEEEIKRYMPKAYRRVLIRLYNPPPQEAKEDIFNIGVITTINMNDIN